MLIVIHADMRALGYCNRGAREWFTRYQLDWSAFIARGIEAERLLATGDSMAEDVVVAAKKRVRGINKVNAGENNGRQQ